MNIQPENMTGNFLNQLVRKHPDLTRGEIKFCSMLKMSLSTKELANMMNVTPAAVTKKRYRLRKKLGLASGLSLEQYLLSGLTAS